MQRNKNIRLLIILIVLSIITGAVAIYKGTDPANYEKDQFVVANVSAIDRVEITYSGNQNILTLENREWHLNNNFRANLARINDLFIILNEISVRRKAGKNEQEELKKKMMHNGAKVQFFNGETLLDTYYFDSNEKRTLSYAMKENSEVTIVNIPGHNYHIASLFQLESEDWRTGYVFASNWATFDRMELKYPESSAKTGVLINYDRLGYFMPSVTNLDSAKMYQYLEDVSYLQVVDYFNDNLDTLGLNPIASIAIQDIDSNVTSIDFYKSDSLGTVGRSSNKEWVLFRKKDIENLLKSPHDFELQAE